MRLKNTPKTNYNLKSLENLIPILPQRVAWGDEVFESKKQLAKHVKVKRGTVTNAIRFKNNLKGRKVADHE